MQSINSTAGILMKDNWFIELDNLLLIGSIVAKKIFELILYVAIFECGILMYNIYEVTNRYYFL